MAQECAFRDRCGGCCTRGGADVPGLRHPRTFGFTVSRAAGRQLRSRQETVVSQGAAGVPSGVGPESHPGAPRD